MSERALASPALRESPALALALGLTALVLPLELGLVPSLEHAWGFNLWRYLPTPASALLALALLLLCLPGPRAAGLRAFARAFERLGESRGRVAAAALLTLPFLFWLLRERQLFGDSNLLLLTARSGWSFAFPDIGATWLFRICFVAGGALGLDPIALVQALVCVCGAIAVACFAKVAGLLAPSAGRRAVVLGLVLCGGLLRSFAGHVEVYAFVLACTAAYLWSALAFLAGRCRWGVPGLVLGIGVFVHLSFVVLLPTLPLLLWLSPPSAGRAAPRERLILRSVGSLALVGVPTLVFLAGLAVLGGGEDLERAWIKALEILGFRENPHFQHYWVRGWGAESTSATDYVFLSAGHLKYLVNAFFILVPAALPIALAIGARSPRRLLATPETTLLSAATVCSVVYALVLRPLWGPYDWDLFSITAACLACLAARLLIERLEGASLAHVAAVAIGASLLLVTLPFLAVGVAPAKQAGPFTQEAVRPSTQEPAWDAFERQLEPWL